MVMGVMLMLLAVPSVASAHDGLNAHTLRSVNAWKALGHTEVEARRMQIGACFTATLQSGVYSDCLRQTGDTVWDRTHTDLHMERMLAARWGIDLARFGELSCEQQESFKAAVRQLIGVRVRANGSKYPCPSADRVQDTETESDAANVSSMPWFIKLLIGAPVAVILLLLGHGLRQSHENKRPKTMHAAGMRPGQALFQERTTEALSGKKPPWFAWPPSWWPRN